MQYYLLAVLHGMSRLLQICLGRVKALLVLPQTPTASYGLLAIGVSVDLDSSRLDAVSRSVLWGPGGWVPDERPAPVYLTSAATHSAAGDSARRRCRRFDV